MRLSRGIETAWLSTPRAQRSSPNQTRAKSLPWMQQVWMREEDALLSHSSYVLVIRPRMGLLQEETALRI